eukprot:augustus_masked-scaffold_22-processed-gene-1.43-mRNA-1 protein AED:0.42 eAED:0.42 QI:0/0/0/0.5/1/1/2/0/399
MALPRSSFVEMSSLLQHAQQSPKSPKGGKHSMFSKRGSIRKSVFKEVKDVSSNNFSSLKVISSDDFHARFPENYSRRLGEGGMGEVYENLDTKTKKLVALKLVTDKETFKEAEKEVEIYKILQKYIQPSDYIINFINGYFYKNETVSDDFFSEGIVLCLEPAEISLQSINGVQKKTSFSLNLLHISIIAKSVLKGLIELHSLGIIHFDIKPSNILLTGNGKVKICDFGSAVTKGVPKTSSTILYSAPEVAVTTNLTPPVKLLKYTENYVLGNFEQAKKADIFSLGITLLDLWVKDNPLGQYEDADKTDVVVNEIRVILRPSSYDLEKHEFTRVFEEEKPELGVKAKNGRGRRMFLVKRKITATEKKEKALYNAELLCMKNLLNDYRTEKENYLNNRDDK